MITGEGDLVELQATVRYKVTHPDRYLFQVRDPEEIIRAATEAVLRSMVVGRPFHDLLSVRRGEFQEQVVSQLTARLERYDGTGLGIAIDGLSLHDLHPPQDVVDAYYKVARAMEDHDRLKNEGMARAVQMKQKAEADRIKILAQARAAKTEKVLRAQADRAVFLARSQARKELTFEQEMQLHLEAVDAALSGVPPAQVEADSQRRREALMATQAALTDFRLFWETLKATLTGRELVIVDSDKVTGRRHLLLVDPDQFRVPVPMLMPPDRNPPPRSPLHEEGP
jgi:regulator of protease activity HflC (stomatin/prohibitin superfamily)